MIDFSKITEGARFAMRTHLPDADFIRAATMVYDHVKARATGVQDITHCAVVPHRHRGETHEAELTFAMCVLDNMPEKARERQWVMNDLATAFVKRGEDPLGLVTACPMWTSKGRKGELMLEPRLDPNRKEGIVISGVTLDGRQVFKALKVERNGLKVISGVAPDPDAPGYDAEDPEGFALVPEDALFTVRMHMNEAFILGVLKAVAERGKEGAVQ